jgi:hypothetical protein
MARAWRENVLLHLLQGKGFVTAAEVEAQKGWAPGRVEDALDTLLRVRHAGPCFSFCSLALACRFSVSGLGEHGILLLEFILTH